MQKARDGSMIFLYWTAGVELRLAGGAVVLIGSGTPQELGAAIGSARAGAE